MSFPGETELELSQVEYQLIFDAQARYERAVRDAQADRTARLKLVCDAHSIAVIPDPAHLLPGCNGTKPRLVWIAAAREEQSAREARPSSTGT